MKYLFLFLILLTFNSYADCSSDGWCTFEFTTDKNLQIDSNIFEDTLESFIDENEKIETCDLDESCDV